MVPVRIGVLGCAAIARRRMLPAMAAHPDIEIGAVASRNEDTARDVARQYGARPVTGYDGALIDSTVDAIYVPLPAALHQEWVERALRAGRHVLAEKPVTLDPMRTRRLFALADRSGLALLENVMFVYHRQHDLVRRLVADGRIGAVRSLRACFTIPSLPENDIRYDPALGGGSLDDVGIYPVRAAVHLLGRDLTVLGASLTRTGGRLVDTAGAALLRAANGVTAQLSFGLDQAYRNEYELSGSRGTLLVDRAFTPPADRAPRIVVRDTDGTEDIPAQADDQVANTLSAFVTAIRTGRTPHIADCQAQAALLADIRLRAGWADPVG